MPWKLKTQQFFLSAQVYVGLLKHEVSKPFEILKEHV